MSLTVCAVLLTACAVFAGGRIERASAVKAGQQAEAGQLMLTAMLDQETGARGYFETGRAVFLQPWYNGITEFSAAMSRSESLAGADGELDRELAAQQQRSNQWHAMVSGEVARMRTSGTRPTVTQALASKHLMDEFRATNVQYLSQLDRRRDQSLEVATWLSAALVAALALVLIAIAVVVIRHGLRREARRADRQRELRELLQASASEEESQRLLIRHVTRVVPDAGVALMNRNNSDDALEVVFSEDRERTPLGAIDPMQLRPRSCMAVRLSRSHESRPGDDPLLRCDLCGAVAGDVLCEPLLVGGQVIGSLLVAHDRIGERERAQLRESVVQAAPILANQRNLALAERRAASDPLTGLPNRRSADETMKRMAAHAGRSLTPLSVILLDLDRFKQINDLHGHDQGDRALAAIGRVIATTIRASDFAARYGGEEFLLLLPETDRTGAAALAEKVRRAIETTDVPPIGQITGSLGVAAMPDDAIEPENLVRKADRALYAAKARGRNRVETAAFEQLASLPDLGSEGPLASGGSEAPGAEPPEPPSAEPPSADPPDVPGADPPEAPEAPGADT